MNDSFSALHPALTFCYFAAVLLLTMLVLHPVFLALSLLGALGYCAVLPEEGAALATSTGSVLVRLRFQLTDGVTVAALTVSDAVLAAADESESLATTTATLTVENGTVQRG